MCLTILGGYALESFKDQPNTKRFADFCGKIEARFWLI